MSANFKSSGLKRKLLKFLLTSKLLRARAKPPGRKRGALKRRAKPPGKKGRRGRWQLAGHEPFRGYAGELPVSRPKHNGKVKKINTFGIAKDKQRVKNLKQTRLLNLKNPKQKVTFKLSCLKNWQFGKISPITLAITNLFSKTKRNVTQLKSLREIPLLNKRITNRLKRSGFVRIW
ncbi:hypothetical protein GGTG_08974 [Gaeumannomyces tritici R3-111a-1]|uniref:Uncharacterized protein n=1 Tax=Gaeumannomyces tritici (strain R3-111a-1) TaxID=644352 RepID=J3P634_GAET3|nr:hypothetical protein GGTG_08974 [Gaeumannomyces tritici R3-111a-1]EJT75136.1 hypothetical protein GGTG_08974 [Gaeumannomyces tritici R3-111a-1]